MGQVTITLNGRTYRLRCGAGEESRLLELSKHVGAHIDRLVAEFGQIGDDRVMLMASLFIADELWDARGKLDAAMAEPETSGAPRLPHEAAQSALVPAVPTLPGSPGGDMPDPVSDTPAGGGTAMREIPAPGIDPAATVEPPSPPPPEKPVRHGSLEQRIVEARARAAGDAPRRFDES